MKTRKGYTLVEILVAASILSAFMLSIFLLFRQLTTSYRVGEWKASRQKEVQLLMAMLKEDLEKANSAFVIKVSGEAERISPEINISINSLAFNPLEGGDKKLESNTTNQPVAYFAIIKSAVEASAFSELTSGRWQGCSLVMTSRSLNYLRTGDYTRHSTFPVGLPGAVFTAPDSGVSAGGLFEPNNSNDSFNKVNDVSSVAFYLIEDGDKRALQVVIECRLVQGNIPVSSITESTVAGMLRDTKVVSVGM
ncbi:MAG: hypothetical protein CVV41_07790 [Candidatus Riflebacteria bacterium HGW-Riflebacteria-1]|jgi:prepilin-type N-terminal cleavage/methylation domain-containing protein|nr:MAG: hypothetical protein CVV41_07790 [Candidatus Riflebacteria bacterium HGW-Riflebacteria-1]